MNTGIILAIAITAAVPGAVQGQTTIHPTDEQRRRSDQISVMEGTLTGSVRLAATSVARDVQSNTPGATMFTGEARAKGFTLDGYGAFFYVEIPALDLNLVLSIETLERNAQRRSEIQASNLQPSEQTAVPSAAKDALRSVAAEDPGQKYRDAVKRCLIDAMLDNSKSMDLGPDEWLTVAARGSESGLIPGEIYQLTTLVLKVKGSDLADFLAGRVTKEQARQKVEVRQF
ncbi:MAG TPA: hypothetical protein VK595_15920 [Vicinamibacterales bacterium]|nr:hypothetical protein [Vicinamibacterales bacterium]